MRWPAWLVPLLFASCVLSRPLTPPESAGPEAAAEVGWTVLAMTKQGRPIHVRTLGRGPRRVLWVGGIHGDEREGAVATAELPSVLQATPGFVEAVTLTMVEDLNPDGTAARRRGNAAGVDLNRNFPAHNFESSPRTGKAPLDQAEARVLHDLIRDWTPQLVIVAHSSVGRKFINGDGPADALVARFAALSGYPVVPSEELHATPGSLGSWVGRDCGTAILTVEYRKGDDPRQAWVETRAAILAAITGDG